jgi:YjbE family integral membrane protein
MGAAYISFKGNIMDTMFWAALLGIVWIDLLLSGDNALVIAMVSRQLPANQQKWGIIGGTVAAIGLRVAMAFFAAALLGVPGLSLIGGAFLLYVAAKLVMGGDEDEGSLKPAVTLWAAIGTIAAADASMSLDNVMAIAALSHGSQLLMALGVLLSIPLVIAGAAIISKLIGRFPVLVWAGGALLAWVAGGIIAADPWAVPYVDHYMTAAACVVAVLVVGWFSQDKGLESTNEA